MRRHSLGKCVLSLEGDVNHNRHMIAETQTAPVLEGAYD